MEERRVELCAKESFRCLQNYVLCRNSFCLCLCLLFLCIWGSFRIPSHGYDTVYTQSM